MIKDVFPDKISQKKLEWECRLMRYHLSLKNQTLEEEILLEKNLEFPRIREDLDGKKYRYLYMTIRDQEKRGIVKFDTEMDQSLTWLCENCEPVEPVFIPNPDGFKEDEGVILTIMYNEKSKENLLLVLDGETLKEIARALIPFYIPENFHGQFFSESTFVN